LIGSAAWSATPVLKSARFIASPWRGIIHLYRIMTPGIPSSMNVSSMITTAAITNIISVINADTENADDH